MNGFGFGDLLDELRCWETDRLQRERDRVVCEKRKLEARELAVTKMLDERRALAPDLAARDGVSEATVRRTLETARRLESLPAVADAALAGRFSAEQLAPTVELADEDSDGEWAARAVGASPMALQRMARELRVPTREESIARRNARYLRKWRDDTRGMPRGDFAIPMAHGGAEIEAVFDALAERMRPGKGEGWEKLERRHADVLIGLAQSVFDDGAGDEARAQAPTSGTPVVLHVQVPLAGPATLSGIPLPAEWVEAARAMANVEIAVIDDLAQLLATGRTRPVVSLRKRQAVIRRDGHCRWPGCRRRLRLQVHHLTPVSWGGSDDMSNLASVCPAHHALLIPHGGLVLEGNPNQPDGLTSGSSTAKNASDDDQCRPRSDPDGTTAEVSGSPLAGRSRSGAGA